jgi:hypothetical protein
LPVNLCVILIYRLTAGAVRREKMNLHILGIRHHGVGSSANLVRRLEEIAPDCILIEGPSELLDCILRVDLGEFVPPVAIWGTTLSSIWSKTSS